jgi:hypothetical protein
MSPAEEMRAAAKLLREMAAKATPGPWFNHDTWLPHGGYTATVLSGKPGNGELRAWAPTWSNEPWDQKRNSWNDAAWMAFMAPDVAPGIASLMEHYAEAVAWSDNWDEIRNCGKPMKQFARSILASAAPEES